MTDAAKSIRFPAAVLALINAECDRTGKALSTVVIDACLAQLGGGEAAPSPTSPRRSAAVVAAPKADRAKAALASAEARQGVPRARLDTSMVAVYDGKKRPAYPKGQAGQGKAGSKGRGR